MKPKIIILKEQNLVGISLQMSLTNNRTAELWGTFGPKIKTIKNRKNADKISLQVYPEDYFKSFRPSKPFKKWATVAVTSIDDIPADLNTFCLEGGLYAVFQYKGSGGDNTIFQYIFSEWIPKSIYKIDNRPHFEVLGNNYKNNDPNSEEEIWIPIKEK